MILYDGFISDPNTTEWWNYDRSIVTEPGRGCRMVVRRCERFPTAPVRLDVNSTYGYRDNNGAKAPPTCEAGGVVTLFDNPWDLPDIPVTEYLDQGCVPLETTRDGTLWISVSYP